MNFKKACGLFIAAVAIGSSQDSKAQVPDHAAVYDTAAAAWEQAATGQPSVKVMANLLAAMSEAWEQNTELVRDSRAYSFGQAAIVTAGVLADDSQMAESAFVLKKAGQVIRDYGVDVTRGRGASHLEEVAGLHAKVLTATGNDPFAGTAIAYELMREGDHLIAIQEGKETDSAELMDRSLLLPNEKEGKLIYMDSAGRVLQVRLVSITPGTGPLRSRLGAMFEPQPSEPEGPCRYERGAVDAFFAKQTGATKASGTRALPGGGVQD